MVNKFSPSGHAPARLETLRRQLLEQARQPLVVAGAAARIAVRSGLLWEMGRPALGALVRERLRGPLGPGALIRIHAACRPEAPALSDGDRRLSYGELDVRVGRLARALRDTLGIAPRSAVALVLKNRLEAIEAQAALQRIGASAVSTSYRSTDAELEYLFTHSGARAVITEPDLHEVVLRAAERSGLGADRIVVASEGGAVPKGSRSYDAFAERGEPLLGLGSEDAAVVIYTSGTTGKPKGAVRKFGKDSHVAYLQMIAELPLRADDRHLAICPLYHSTAYGFATMTLAVGGCVVLGRKFEPQATLALIEKERITTSAMVPTMLHRMLELPAEVQARHDLRTLRAVFSGGAPLSGTLARAFMERYGHVLWNFYGATETGINTIATPTELLDAPGTIGHAVPGNEIRILSDEGRACATGVTGELFVKNSALVSYHRDDDATAGSMKEGFFSVGDLAHVDARGLFHIDGRKRDMIITGGVNVYPAEVEEVLHAHPDVGEAAVVGLEDADLGERVSAFVSPREGRTLEPAELVAFCKARLSGPKIPREIRILPELPKNPTGKVLKRELRRRS